MKNILLALFLLTIPASSFCQNKSLNKFYRHYKKGKAVKNFKIPGWLIHLGSNIARKHVDDEEMKIALQLSKSLKKIKLMYAEDEHHVPPSAVNKLVKDLHKQSFDDWIYVRDKGTTVNFMVREKNNTIKNILVLVNEENSFALVSIKTKLHLEKLAEVINKLIHKYKMDIFEEEKPVEKPPQV